MTRGGTGDVLAGLVAGIINRTEALFDAAVAGVYINSVAGIVAYKRYGSSSPLNLIRVIPEILRDPGRYGLKDLMEL
jgi:NAD(P)H-hydrate epimerase